MINVHIERLVLGSDDPDAVRAALRAQLPPTVHPAAVADAVTTSLAERRLVRTEGAR